MKPITCGIAALICAASIGCEAHAGPATDNFGKCLVQSSTGKDRIVFVQWFFAALSVNPNVHDYATATPEQRAAVARQAADVLQRLVLTACRTEAVAAIREDGNQAIESSFEVFGRSAATELMSDPAVGKEMNAISNYIDNDKWAQLANEAKK